jgi:hypothetical protein
MVRCEKRRVLTNSVPQIRFPTSTSRQSRCFLQLSQDLMPICCDQAFPKATKNVSTITNSKALRHQLASVRYAFKSHVPPTQVTRGNMMAWLSLGVLLTMSTTPATSLRCSMNLGIFIEDAQQVELLGAGLRLWVVTRAIRGERVKKRG